MIEMLADDATVSERAAAADLSELIGEMLRGNERALEELYDATVGKLYALAAAILKSVEDAEEVVCMTYAYAWANASRYDAARGNVLGWLLMLCRSRALDCLRRRQLSLVSADTMLLDNMEAEGGRPDDILSLMQQRSDVYAALLHLTPERRQLVSLAFLQGMSHQEIAHATGMALGTVKSHLRRALAQLREQLEGA
jgi:RNA polymerase sigma-70 factor (ECF subfamily)